MDLARVLFLATPKFAIPTLEGLLSNPSIEIVGVVTPPDKKSGRNLKTNESALSYFAKQMRLPLFKFESVNSADALKVLKPLNVDCVLVIAFGQILSVDFLKSFPMAINMHASLLPKLRGASPIQRALMNGDRVTGITMQFMHEKVDRGDIIASFEQVIDDDMTYVDLCKKLEVLTSKLAQKYLLKVIRGEVSAVKQDDTLATYATKIKKDEGFIDFNAKASDIYNLYRGLYSWPGVYFKKGGLIKITKMKLGSLSAKKSGMVLGITKNHMTVSCKEGSVDILRLKPESRKDMSAYEFANGFKVEVGCIIND